MVWAIGKYCKNKILYDNIVHQEYLTQIDNHSDLRLHGQTITEELLKHQARNIEEVSLKDKRL